MEELRIDPEFKGKIPPLTEAEYLQLEENILTAGEVYEPIVTWNGIIVDGHNRYKIITEHPEVKWRTREMNFADKWAAFDWMYKNQLGRRNLTEAQRTYLIGKLYEARKHTHGGDRKSSMQKADLKRNDGRVIRTDETVAKELGINPSTVDRASHFANGIDAIREKSQETADKVLSGKLTPKKADVMAIGKASSTEQPRMIKQIERGERVATSRSDNKIAVEKPKTYNGGTREHRDEMNRIAGAVADLLDATSTRTYTLSDLIAEITNTARMFINTIRNAITDHKDIAKSNNDDVKKCIVQTITNEIEKIMEELK